MIPWHMPKSQPADESGEARTIEKDNGPADFETSLDRAVRSALDRACYLVATAETVSDLSEIVDTLFRIKRLHSNLAHPKKSSKRMQLALVWATIIIFSGLPVIALIYWIRSH